MKVTSSYKVEIVGHNKIFEDTLSIYRKMVSFLLDVISKEADYLKAVEGDKYKRSALEHLVHNTKNNVAKYDDFDRAFYKAPSYFRRAAIADALGIYQSFASNYDNWEQSGKHGKPPRLQTEHFTFPSFYKDNMYLESEDPYRAKLKIHHRNDWVWLPIRLKKTDVDYLRKYWSHAKKSTPTLLRKRKKWFLVFSFTEDIKLSDRKIQDRKIVACDLGLNTDCVAVAMDAKGTVTRREFINFGEEKDLMLRLCGRLKRRQRKEGPRNAAVLWPYINHVNKEHAVLIANAIVAFAAEVGADVIVLENLGNMRPRGSIKQRVHLWKKRYIRDLVEHKAHRLGIRVSTVNPRNTSRLAFDGTGEVTRHKDNFSLCTFQSGKVYHADLNAAQNIGARYFVRELTKPLSATARSLVEAEVPSLARRTTVTLADLWQLSKAVA